MDVLIKGERIELPKIDESYIDIRIYGTGEIVIDGDQDKTATAIELPPHGRLIEGDELADVLEQNLEPMLVTRGVSGLQADVIREVVDAIVTMLRECPTVLEAST